MASEFPINKEKEPSKTAFIGIKHFEDGRNTPLLDAIKSAVLEAGIKPYAFIDEGKFEDPHEMMRRAFQKIDESDMVILETSEPSFGVGAEAGRAFGKKPVISLVQEGAETSGTVEGISDSFIKYKDTEDLKAKLIKALKK